MDKLLSPEEVFEELLAIRLMLHLGKLSRDEAMDRICEVLDRAATPVEEQPAVA